MTFAASLECRAASFARRGLNLPALLPFWAEAVVKVKQSIKSIDNTPNRLRRESDFIISFLLVIRVRLRAQEGERLSALLAVQLIRG